MWGGGLWGFRPCGGTAGSAAAYLSRRFAGQGRVGVLEAVGELFPECVAPTRASCSGRGERERRKLGRGPRKTGRQAHRRGAEARARCHAQLA